MDDDPAHRFPTALGFASALEGAARGQSAVLGLGVAAAAGRPEGLRDEEDDDVEDAPSDDVIEDSLDTMAPPVVDVQEEPAEAALEEEQFRAEVAEEPEDLLDLALRDEDGEKPVERFASDFDPDAIDAPGAVTHEEEEAEEEAVETVAAVEDEPLRTTLGAPVFDQVPVATPRGYSSIMDSAPVPDQLVRQRTPVLPYALVGVLTLLLGFGAGYAYATRRMSQEVAALRPQAAGSSTPAPAQGKEFSEQAVTPAQPPGRPPTQAPGCRPRYPHPRQHRPERRPRRDRSRSTRRLPRRRSRWTANGWDARR